MRGRWEAIAPRLAWIGAGLGIVMLLIGGIWDTFQAGGDANWFESIAFFLTFVSFGIVGAILVGRDTRNPLGWILLGVGFFGGLVILSMTYAREGLTGAHGLPGATLAAWFASWTWYPSIQLIFPFLLMYFPTGKLPSRRWRPLLWASLTLMAFTTLGPMFQYRLKDEPFYDVDNPVGLELIEDAEAILNPAFLVLSVVALAAAVSLIVRFRVSSGIERLQLKWFTLAAAITVISLFVEELFGGPEFVFSAGILLLSVSIGIAILRYRLYEIDVLINRALVYGLLTGLAVATYLGLVVALRFLLEPITPDTDIAVAGSTLAVAAVIRPLRAQIQGFIDRRFYRRKYSATKALSDFSSRLRDEVDVEVVGRDVVGVLNETVQPTHVSLWLSSEASR